MSVSALPVRLLGRLPSGRTLPEAHVRVRHSWIVRLLWAHTVALPIVALLYGTGVVHALAEGGAVLGFAIAATLGSTGRRWRAIVAALGLLTCSGVLVHITGGLIEAHFH